MFYLKLVSFRSLRLFSFLAATFHLSFALPSFAAPLQLKLLTLNVKQFPYGISKDNKFRGEKLTQIINAREGEFDVIGLQELWSCKSRKRFQELLKKEYPYQAVDCSSGKFCLGLNSGLAIFSKYPITRTIIHNYTDHRGPENMAKKGILGAEILFHGQAISVFTTHLQAGDGGSFFRFIDHGKPTTVEITKRQIKEAKAVMEAFADPGSPTFLIGDLNVTAGNQEYDEALELLENAYDTFDPALSPYLVSSWNDFPDQKRVDYVLTLRDRIPGFSKILDYFGPSVTDHLGLLGLFTLAGD